MYLRPFMLCLALLLLAPVAKADNELPTPHHRRSVFNGENLHGWNVLNCQAGVEDGLLVIQEGNGLVRTNHRYGDFVFSWECRPRAEEKWDSGIYFRCDLPEGERPFPQRYQVNLLQGQEGELIGFPQTKGSTKDLVKPGDWNSFELTVTGSTAALKVNGKPAWEVDGIEAPEGYIALQVEVPGGGQFEFRNLSIVELGYDPLFNGATLAGWEGAGGPAEACWTVAEGLLKCTGEKGPWLRSAEQYGDFNLRLEYKLSTGGNSGVFIRVPKDGDHHGENAGIEVQVLDDAAPQYKNLKPYQFAGSLYSIVPAEPHVGHPAGEWNTMEIEAQGDTYRVVHNGIEVVNANANDYPALKERLTRGFLGLQNHRKEVFFRNIRIRELGETQTAAEE